MIRVVLRHYDDADSRLLGDFPPDQIAALMELIATARVYWDDDRDDCGLFTQGDSPQQFVQTVGGNRVILEILVE